MILFNKIYYFLLILILKLINKTFNTKNTYNIIHNLYIGNFISSFHIKNYDIIINCTKELPFFSNKINVRIPIDDNYIIKNNDVVNYFYLIDYIFSKNDIFIKNKKILIHCRFGLQRSCFIAQYILYKYYNLNLKKSYELIKNKKKNSFFPYHNFKHISLE